MRRMLAAGLLLGAVGCSGKDEDSGAGVPPPDPSGEYNSVVIGTVGCEGEPGWLNDWAAGPLVVRASGHALELDFGGGDVLTGELKTDSTFRVTADLSKRGASLAVTGTGEFTEGAERWQLAGDLSAVVDDGADQTCTVEGPFEAAELIGAE